MHNISLPSWEYSFNINYSRLSQAFALILSPLLFRVEHLPEDRFKDAAKQVTTRKYAAFERNYIFNER